MSAFTIALTGGIASGKSALATRFDAIGVPIIDADVIAHELTRLGQPALRDIVEEFGEAVLAEDGNLDRNTVRELVFNEPDARHRLEAILHPLIHAEIQQRARSCAADFCLLAIPLLIETRNDYSWVDRVLIIDVPRETQIQRLIQRPRISAELAERIVGTQATRPQRLLLGHDVIDNTAPIRRLDCVVSRLHRLYTRLALSNRGSARTP